MAIKSQLHQACQEQLKERLTGLENRLLDLREALENETKSSAGDKYETSRAMVHQEQEKLLRQQAVLRQQQQHLSTLKITIGKNVAQLGSLVLTNRGAYYLSIPLGRVEVEGRSYYVLSLAAPLGKVLLGKCVGECFTFNQQSFEITGIE